MAVVEVGEAIAAYYGAPTADSETTAEEAVRVRLEQLAGLRCQLDPRLVGAARTHAKSLAGNGVQARSSDLDHLRFAVQRRGGVDYWLLPFYGAADEDGIAALGRALGSSDVRRFTHCGLGLADDEQPVVVLLLSDRVMELSALPTQPAPWSSLSVTGTVRSGARLSRAYLGLPDGRVNTLLVAQRGQSGFAIQLSLTSPGRYDLELGVDLGHGEETALLLPLYVGVEPEPRPTVVPEKDKNTELSAATLLGYINATRSRSGLAPLVLSGSLGKLARQHSSEMVDLRFFGHVSPTAGDLLARLMAAGLSPGKYAENVARSRTLIRLHSNLKASPSHRMHLLDPTYTHVGIGIAHSGDDLVVTEIFARF